MGRVGRWHLRRERSVHTRAVSFVVSRGFGTHVKLTLWWFSIGYHRRDQELEALMSESIRQAERRT